jgi:hypothetical protein
VTTLACPHCGETRLWSDEPTTIMYPAVFTRDDAGDVTPDYTGDSYDVMDEGTEYVGNIWCRSCGTQLAESDLVESDARV